LPFAYPNQEINFARLLMKNGNKRSPDIAFFAKEGLQGLEELPTGFLEGGPDLVVEILSPGNTVAEIEDKIAEYFANGRDSFALGYQSRSTLCFSLSLRVRTAGTINIRRFFGGGRCGSGVHFSRG